MINCCAVDWFDVWPDDALGGVAKRYLNIIGETVLGQPLNPIIPLKKKVKTILSNIFVNI